MACTDMQMPDGLAAGSPGAGPGTCALQVGSDDGASGDTAFAHVLQCHRGRDLPFSSSVEFLSSPSRSARVLLSRSGLPARFLLE